MVDGFLAEKPVAPLPVAAAASVPGTVQPAKGMSDAVNPVTDLVKTTVNLIGDAAVGSAWPGHARDRHVVGGAAARHCRRQGPLRPHEPRRRGTAKDRLAGMDAFTSPGPVMPETATL